MNYAKTVKNMQAAGMTDEAIVVALKCIEEANPSIVLNVHTVDGRATQAKAGPEERWGYTGPVTPMLPEKEWWPLRWSILKRDNFTCAYCGVSGQENAKWCVDHIIPLSRGGTHDNDNLTACCFPCNSSKSDRLLSEWKGRYV